MMFPYCRCPYLLSTKPIYPYFMPYTWYFSNIINLPVKDLYETYTRNVHFSPLQSHILPEWPHDSKDEKYYLSLDPSPSTKLLRQTRSHDELNNIETAFRALIETDLEKALYLINHETLPFTSLFWLRHDIEKHGVFDQLSLRNRTALSIVNEILLGKRDTLSMPCSYCDYIQTVHSVLKWILETGSIDDGLSNDYDQVLDITAVLLIKIYRDKTILSTISDMIFKRYTKGHFINDLVWAFFQSHDPNSLIFIADHLKSEEPKEIELARKLLRFCPSIDDHSKTLEEYTAFTDWLKENSSFLSFTGESFQQSTNPMPYVVILEAKYLYKTVDLLTGRSFEAFTENESLLLDEYKELDNDTKILLANFSYRLHQRDLSSWKTWIDYPIEKQLSIAKSNREVR
ncbi:MAG: hypothetical protein K0R93_257 [Anaerosolibacter sp.]|nr:hypothetical protein [Anaerosolibacter sp.]